MPGTLHHTLLAQELRLLDPAVRRNRAEVAALLAPEFREVGRGGRSYSKEDILDRLAAEAPSVVAIEHFAVQLLGPEAALATYTSVHGSSRAYRSSVWVWREGRWLLVYHQGTAAP